MHVDLEGALHPRALNFENKEWRRALALFEQMLNASLQASVIACDAAISACDPAEETLGTTPLPIVSDGLCAS